MSESNLTELARREPRRFKSRIPVEAQTAVVLLDSKGWTHGEIARWLTEHGHPCGAVSVSRLLVQIDKAAADRIAAELGSTLIVEGTVPGPRPHLVVE